MGHDARGMTIETAEGTIRVERRKGKGARSLVHADSEEVGQSRKRGAEYCPSRTQRLFFADVRFGLSQDLRRADARSQMVRVTSARRYWLQRVNLGSASGTHASIPKAAPATIRAHARRIKA